MNPIISQFLDRTLPKLAWTHEAHLTVGLWHVSQFGYEEALRRMRSGIMAYNEAVGTPNTDTSGYHETLTQFWLRVLDACWKEADPTQPFDLICETLLASSWADRQLAGWYYSKQRLFSPEARANWLDSDLNPLDFNVQSIFSFS